MPKEKNVGTAPDFVVVCCKIPNGLDIAVPGTAVTVKVNGSHSAYAVFGHGRTNVPRSDWEAIEAYYATHPGAKWLHNGMVFAEKDADNATDRSEDRQQVKAGFEPIDPVLLAQDGANGKISPAK